MDKKICPICRGFLEEVEISNKYGFKIRIDKCPSGCGLWFDQFELYQVNLYEAEKAFKELPAKDNEKKGNTEEEILCPGCQIPMTKVKSVYLSNELEIDYCKGCSGIWLEREKFLKYKILIEGKTGMVKREIKVENIEYKPLFERGKAEKTGLIDYIMDIFSKLF